MYSKFDNFHQKRHFKMLSVKWWPFVRPQDVTIIQSILRRNPVSWSNVIWITLKLVVIDFSAHYSDFITGTMVSRITSLTIVYSTVYSDQGKHQSSASLAFVRGIHRWAVNSQHKWPVRRKMFPFDDVIMDSLTMSCQRRPRQTAGYPWCIRIWWYQTTSNLPCGRMAPSQIILEPAG